MRYALTSFQRGVISPRRSAALDPETYLQSLQIGQNFIITPQGGLLFREGRRLLQVSEQGRLFQFHQGGDRSDVVIEVVPTSLTNPGSGEVRLYEISDGRDLTAPFLTFDNLLIPDWEPDYTIESFLEQFYLTNTERQAALCHPWIPPYIIKSDFNAEYVGAHITEDQIPEVRYLDEKSPAAAAVRATYLLEFAGWEAGDRFAVIYGDDIANSGAEDGSFFFPIWSPSMAANANIIRNALKATIYLLSRQSDVTVEHAGTLGNGNEQFDVTITGKNAGLGLAIESRTNKAPAEVIQDQISTDILEPAWSFPFVVSNKAGANPGNTSGDPTGWRYYRCKVPHYYGVGDPVGPPPYPGRAENEPGVGTDWEDFWEDLGTDPPGWYEYAYFDEEIHDGLPPHYWNSWANRVFAPVLETGVYSPRGRGWPEVSAYFQQRLIFLAAKDAPTSVWGSRIGDYDDFQPGVNDADPFFFDLDTSDSPRIKWAEANQAALIIGTSAGDFRLGSQITLAPTDLSLTKQNGARSYKTRAMTLENTAFYIEQGREKIRGTLYGEERNAWTSIEYSQMAEHLFRGKVKRMVLTQAPEPLAYILRDDGDLIAMSWMPAGDYFMPAFTEITCRGAIQDICGYYDFEREQDVLLLLTRYDDGAWRWEYLPYPEAQVAERIEQSDQTLHDQGIVHLDTWQAQVLVDTDKILLFDDQLSGTVAVLVDNAYIGEFEIVDATIILPQPFTGTAVFGYPYRGVAKTFEVQGTNPAGPALGTKRGWANITARILDSAIPLINGQRAPERRPQKNMDIPDLVVGGLRDIQVSDLGRGDGSLLIEQDRPYPTHVVAIFGEIETRDA